MGPDSPPPGGPLLEVADLTAWYGDALVVRDVSLRLGVGEVVALSGRNGAGKTTLLRAIMGLHRQFSGVIRCNGVDITRAEPHQRARLGLGWVPDDRGAYATLNVAEALSLSHVRSERSWSAERVFDTFPALARRRDAQVNRLSGGEQQMLALACVLRMGSAAVLADEPTEGLSPLIVEQVGELLGQLRAEGASVLLVEQNIHFAATVADRHYLLAAGRVVAEHSREELVNREHELLAHLGM
jgi:branched-chain amino acid transport system ATP-binding protein